MPGQKLFFGLAKKPQERTDPFPHQNERILSETAKHEVTETLFCFEAANSVEKSVL